MTIVRGSPDHTVLAEQSFAHYTDKIDEIDIWPPPPAPDYEDVINVDIRGVWGHMFVHTNCEHLRVEIIIDETTLYAVTPHTALVRGWYGFANPHMKFNLTAYNPDSATMGFSMVFDEKWGLYIHQKLQVRTRLDLAGGNWATFYTHYKELH
jgi:hypothetical protein